jgi:hypothetical protein
MTSDFYVYDLFLNNPPTASTNVLASSASLFDKL